MVATWSVRMPMASSRLATLDVRRSSMKVAAKTLTSSAARPGSASVALMLMTAV
jgi:hypothetical protein